MMPNIHGFPQLMAMLFAPKVELHRDTTQTRYASLLCGLGYDEKTGESRYREHDLTLKFDTFIDQDDIKHINQLRYNMSALLHIGHGQKFPDLKPNDIITLMKNTNTTLIKFLQKDRKFIDERPQENADNVWGVVKEEDLQIVDGTQVLGDRAIFPSFTFMKLEPEDPEHIERFRDNNAELHAIAFCKAGFVDCIDCLLCSKTLTNVEEIKTHLFTKLHIDRAEQCHAKFQLQNYKA